jgi:hypothetical protein
MKLLSVDCTRLFWDSKSMLPPRWVVKIKTLCVRTSVSPALLNRQLVPRVNIPLVIPLVLWLGHLELSTLLKKPLQVWLAS